MESHYFVRLVPHRATFAQDMTADERVLMQQHAAYWRGHMERGNAVVFGRVLDPAGVYGVGVVLAESEEEVRMFAADDPAGGLNQFKIYRMMAVLPGNAEKAS